MEASRPGGSRVIRSGRRGDAASVVALWRAVPDVLPTVSDDEAAVAVLIARDPGALLVTEVAGRIVGSVVAGWDGWRGNLYRLAVALAHQRQGVASELVDEAERRLRAAGCRRIAANVTVTEDHAVGFWRAAGYALGEDSRRFVKTLDPGSAG
jgi:ribosomal protein S18 acetylase RimI-like enzyme